MAAARASLEFVTSQTRRATVLETLQQPQTACDAGATAVEGVEVSAEPARAMDA